MQLTNNYEVPHYYGEVITPSIHFSMEELKEASDIIPSKMTSYRLWNYQQAPTNGVVEIRFKGDSIIEMEKKKDNLKKILEDYKEHEKERRPYLFTIEYSDDEHETTDRDGYLYVDYVSLFVWVVKNEKYYREIEL